MYTHTGFVSRYIHGNVSSDIRVMLKKTEEGWEDSYGHEFDNLGNHKSRIPNLFYVLDIDSIKRIKSS